MKTLRFLFTPQIPSHRTPPSVPRRILILRRRTFRVLTTQERTVGPMVRRRKNTPWDQLDERARTHRGTDGPPTKEHAVEPTHKAASHPPSHGEFSSAEGGLHASSQHENSPWDRRSTSGRTLRGTNERARGNTPWDRSVRNGTKRNRGR